VIRRRPYVALERSRQRGFLADRRSSRAERRRESVRVIDRHRYQPLALLCSLGRKDIISVYPPVRIGAVSVAISFAACRAWRRPGFDLRAGIYHLSNSESSERPGQGESQSEGQSATSTRSPLSYLTTTPSGELMNWPRPGPQFGLGVSKSSSAYLK
jgi:hypothetical protein